MRNLRFKPGQEVEQLEGFVKILCAGGDGQTEAAGKAGILVHHAPEPPGREAEVQVLVVAGKGAQVPVAAHHHRQAAGAKRIETGHGRPAGAELGRFVDAADGVDTVILPLHRLHQLGVVQPGGAVILHELGAVGPGVDIVAAVAITEHLAGHEAHDLDRAVVGRLGQLLRQRDHRLPILRRRRLIGLQTLFLKYVLVPDDEAAIGVERDRIDLASPYAFGPGGREVVVPVDVILVNKVVQEGCAAATGPAGHAESILAGDVGRGAAGAGGHQLGRHLTPFEGHKLDRDVRHHLLVLLDLFLGPVGGALRPEREHHLLHRLVRCSPGIRILCSRSRRHTGCGQGDAEPAGGELHKLASRESPCLHGNRSF